MACARGKASAASGRLRKTEKKGKHHGECLADRAGRELNRLLRKPRAGYTLLSRCYEKEIDAAFAADFAGHAALESDDAALADGFAALQACLADLDEAALEQLAVVFNRVFFGMGPRTAQKAFPYESVYTSPDGLMMQEAYAQVRTLYHAARFAKDPTFPEPEDHLAVELAFLRDHLLRWIEPFAADACASAETGFYAHLATFTETYLKADESALEEVVG